MSRYLERYKSKRGGPASGPSAAADFEGLPLLSELMNGVPTQDGRGWEMPPHTLTLWLEGSVVKFAIGAGELMPKCFGTFPALSEGLLGVETALDKDRCEWKDPKKPK